MAKNKIFKSAAKKKARMEAKGRQLKKADVSSMTRNQLLSFIKQSEEFIAFKGQRQKESLSGYQSSLVSSQLRQIQKRTEPLTSLSKETLLTIAQSKRKIITSSKLNITAAREERSNKLQALRNIGIKRPRSSDLYTFWTMWDELTESGLPAYLQKQTGQDINGLYSLVDAYEEYKQLPASERTDENLREMAMSNFANLQRAITGPDYDKIKESAEANWKKKHPGKKLNRPLTTDELRMYSTYGVGKGKVNLRKD